jgi:PAS domain S-box-containing protein
MPPELHILHLEDDADDAEFVRDLLDENGFSARVERVQTRDAFIAALDRGGLDLILSDYKLPAFDGLAALELARAKCPDVPFIFVSGLLGEEAAIDALKSGATDYVLKHRLPRLVPAVRRAVADAEERLALQRAEAAMIQSEHKYRQLFECLGEAALLADSKSNRVIDTNLQAGLLFGRPRAELMGMNVADLLQPDTFESYRRNLAEPEATLMRVVFEGEIRSSDGRAIPVSVSASSLLLYGRHLVLGLYRDISERKHAEAEIQRLKEELARHSPRG